MLNLGRVLYFLGGLGETRGRFCFARDFTAQKKLGGAHCLFQKRRRFGWDNNDAVNLRDWTKGVYIMYGSYRGLHDIHGTSLVEIQIFYDPCPVF